MIKTLRIAACAIFMLSLFGLTSCNRRTNEWSDCGPSICAPCSPCQPACNTRASCGPKNSCSQPFSGSPQPCAQEPSPYFPCNPSLIPCGTGNCNPKPQETCFRNMLSYETCDDCVVDLVQLAPEFATVGSAYPVEIQITARKECAYVQVEQTLPFDAAFIRSEPEACPDCNGQLHWEFAHMDKGETQRIVVWVKPQKEGCCVNTATICACPQLCAYTNCGQPVVCIKKCGPACACLYCPISYRIDVCNSGSAPAYDVTVQDNLPDGLTHSSGYRCLTYELGTLCPGDSRTINVDLCAAKRGTVTNTATVSYCGGPKCTAEATTIINEPCVEVMKTGPDWSYLCKPVEYTITVTNPGDLILYNMVVDDISPAGTTIICAPGAEICCNRASWCIDRICPGETMVFKLTVCSQVAGCLTNKVEVRTESDCGPCSQCAEATTLWRGIPATHMCMVDTCDPICVGQTTVYRICVTNRGTADDCNVQLVIRFTDELVPQCVNGPTGGNISGNTVTFAPLQRLGEKESVEYTVTVKSVASGNAKAEATLNSDGLGEPNTQVETTHVY